LHSYIVDTSLSVNIRFSKILWYDVLVSFKKRFPCCRLSGTTRRTAREFNYETEIAYSTQLSAMPIL
jgi:hypothetical protein